MLKKKQTWLSKSPIMGALFTTEHHPSIPTHRVLLSKYPTFLTCSSLHALVFHNKRDCYALVTKQKRKKHTTAEYYVLNENEQEEQTKTRGRGKYWKEIWTGKFKSSERKSRRSNSKVQHDRSEGLITSIRPKAKRYN